METFNEWMGFRSPSERADRWMYVTDSEEDTRESINELLTKLFREFSVDGPYNRGGTQVYLINGDPQVTLFELEEAGIRQDMG